MKILLFAVSLRKSSFNRNLAGQVFEILKTLPNLEIDHADYKDFEMPIYDGDAEVASGIPKGGQELISRIQKTDAIVICTPEYNGGIPGTLKNAIDWVSRAQPNPLMGKHVLLTGASPGALGAVRGLWHTRVPFEALGSFVFPEMFGLSQAHEAFDESHLLKDPKKRDQLSKLVQRFVENAN